MFGLASAHLEFVAQKIAHAREGKSFAGSEENPFTRFGKRRWRLCAELFTEALQFCRFDGAWTALMSILNKRAQAAIEPFPRPDSLARGCGTENLFNLSLPEPMAPHNNGKTSKAHLRTSAVLKVEPKIALVSVSKNDGMHLLKIPLLSIFTK